MLMTDDTLLAQIKAFLERTGMKPTRFGIETLKDGGLVKGLEDGRSLSLKSAAKVVEYMAEHSADNSRAAA